MSYIELKERAVIFRKRGFSYSEILKQIPVAKSTLSLWLCSVGLSKKQKQRLTEKKLVAMKRGAKRKHEIKLEKIKRIYSESKKDIKNISDKELFLIGIALYWAEGAKEKPTYANGIKFINSDVSMLKIFIIWLKKFLNISSQDLIYELYIHNNADLNKAIKFWINNVNIKKEDLRIYFKSSGKLTKRKNIGDKYNGLLRVKVKKSTDLNRKIEGWINAIVKCTI